MNRSQKARKRYDAGSVLSIGVRMFFRRLRINSLLLIFSSTLLISQSLSPIIQRMRDSVSVPRLTAQIDSLQRAGGHWNRANFTPGNDSAVAYVLREFKKMTGLSSVRLDTFFVPSAQSPFDTKPMFNVVARMNGSEGSRGTIVIGAHIDACGSRMPEWALDWSTMVVPGADDNASGVSVVMELARLFGDPSFGFSPAHTIEFVAFGVEETGPAYTGYLYGSDHYVRKAKERGENIIAMVCVDMVGFNDNNLYLDIVTNDPSRWISNHFMTMKNNLSVNLTVREAPLPYTWSDHSSFWNHGFPAVCLIECAPPNISNEYYTANTYFHTSSDSLALLNMNLVSASAQLTLVSVATIADAQTSVTQRNDLSLKEFGLQQNFPNPFNPVTNINYRIPEYGHVFLQVFDMLGREVTTLVNEEKPPGTYSVRFSAAQIPGGVYFYRLTAGSIASTKKMVVMK